MIAALCFLLLPRHSSADWQNPVGVCKDSRGCGSGSESVRGSNSSPGGGSMPWGHMTSRGLEKVKSCGDPLCWMIQGPIALTIGAVCDAPYYIVKGVGYGLYYGGRGLGKGLASIGRGIAYPFNRPSKPKLPPTTWEQYKHDVLKHQKALAKADKANKETQRWCVKNVPLEISPNRARWESICNAGDAVSRAALPPDIVASGLTPVSLAASPATVIVDGSAPIVNPSAEAGQAPAAPGAEASELPATSNVAYSDETLTAAPPVGAPVPSPAEAAPGDMAPAESNPAVPQQQAVQIGVAPDIASEKAGLDPAGAAETRPPVAAGFSDGSVAIAGTVPTLITQGKSLRTLPSATPANSLTPSEYGFEGRHGYGARYNQVWGKATPAEEFIERWNIIPPIESMQKKVRELAIAEGTEYSKKTLFERMRGAVLDALKRIRGGAGIVDRAKETQGGRTAYAKYAAETLDQGIESMKMAADGRINQALDSSAGQEKSLQRLQHGTVETVMGQVGDPVEKLKDAALEDAKENFPLSMPKKQSIRQATICHTSDPLGIGCSKAKLIYSPPR